MNEKMRGLGIGDWGLGIGDWGMRPNPNPPTPNPKPPTPNPPLKKNLILNINYFKKNKFKN